MDKETFIDCALEAECTVTQPQTVAVNQAISSIMHVQQSSIAVNSGYVQMDACQSNLSSDRDCCYQQPSDFGVHSCDNSNDGSCYKNTEVAESRQNKRQREYPNWKDITDPEERKKQRRLAKNRATAARSRERKRAEVECLQDQNRLLTSQLGQVQHESFQLKQYCQSLESQLQSLREELEQMRNQVASRTSDATTSELAAGPAESKFTPPTLQLVVLAHLLLRRNRIFTTLFSMLTFWVTMAQDFAQIQQCETLLLQQQQQQSQQKQQEQQQLCIDGSQHEPRPGDPGGATFAEEEKRKLEVMLKGYNMQRFLRQKIYL